MTGTPVSWTLFGQGASRTYYEAAQLQSMSQWWHWLLLVTVGLCVMAYVARIYRRDGRELPRAIRWLLILLRVAAFVGLLLFFLKIEKRIEQKLVKNSRAILLVDTSQSMGLSDETTDGGVVPSRLELVAQELGGGFLEKLQLQHDVVVYQFDQHDHPSELVTLPRTSTSHDDEQASQSTKSESAKREAKWLVSVAVVACAVALAAAFAHVLLGALVRNGDGDSWALLVAISFLLVAGVVYSVSNLRNPHWGWRQVLFDAPVVQPTKGELQPSDQPSPAQDIDTDWIDRLVPSGVETRLGEAMQFIVEKERGGPIAAVTVFTDGNGNAGVDYRDAITVAQDAEIPIHLVGLGSDRQPTNVRVVDVDAPARVYPGDAFKIRGFLQSSGMTGQSVKVELSSLSAKDVNKENANSVFEEEQLVVLSADGEVHSVEFEVTPRELGERLYVVTVQPTSSEVNAEDNFKSARVRIVDRKNKVLILAGGPTREYRFVRNMLFRDSETTTAVLLQSSGPGSAQEADEVLVEFPTTPQDLFQYDCLLAFDPDWQALSDSQLELLDRWVAERSGGLILVAGPVFTPEWTTLRRDRRGTRILKGLYPVTFFSRSVMRLARGQIPEHTSSIRFTDDGRNARYLWLDDTAARSAKVWSQFDGVYSTFPVNGIKPGATLLAELDRGSRTSESPSAFLVEQFFGAGRVVFVGSGELWRLNEVDLAYFETFYTKLIRHASQGRLLRDSSRGVLLVGKDRCVLGETVTVRAALSDAQYRPLQREQVEATVIDPMGVRQTLPLVSVSNAIRAGSFVGQFTAVREGDYRVELIVPETDDLELLTRDVRVRVPELEIESPQRNDAVMNEIAQATGGAYFRGTGQLSVGPKSLLSAIVPQDQETYLPGTPDRKFQQRLMGWLMALICGVLSVEWLIRRLNKLA